MRFRNIAMISASIVLIGSSANAAPAQAPKDQGQPRAQKYCVQYENDTGSRLRRQECRTREEWQRLGVDIGEGQRK
jgi:hypothetical protein